MDYKKKYEEALERAKEMYEDGMMSERIEYIFPEIIGGEDESIIKWIKKELENKYVEDGIVNNVLADKAFAWLEKQKHLYETTKDRFYCEGFEEGRLYEKQGEQKPTRPIWKYKKDNTPLLMDSLILNKYGCVAKSPSGAIVSDVWVLDYDEIAKLPKEEIENQIEQKETLCDKCKREHPSHFCQDITALGRCALEHQYKQIPANSAKTCKDEQKHADKPEPKFKVGDWVVENITNGIFVGKITSINMCFYGVDGLDGNWYHIDFFEEEQMHLWTIQDAEDGDVLHSIGWHGDCTFIFNSLDKWRFDKPNGDRAIATGYCCLSVSSDKMEFGIQGPDCIEVDTVKPATKEQRDALMKVMADAGYIFDFEKKELKKIDQKPAWDEDDEYQINTILHGLDLKRALYKKEGNQVEEERYKRQYDWLRSLKDRIHNLNKKGE